MKKLLLLVALLLPLATSAEASDPTIGVPNPIYAANQVVAGPEATEAYAEWLAESKMQESVNVLNATIRLTTNQVEPALDLTARLLDTCTTYGIEPAFDEACRSPREEGHAILENAWDGDA